MAVVDKLLDALLKALERQAAADRARNRELGGRALLRAYYIEVTNNLDLLDCLDKAALAAEKGSVPFPSPAFAAIAARLQTRVARVILTDEEAVRKGGLYDVLRKTGGGAAGGEAAPGKVVYASILEAVAFTVTKIDLLQTLSTLTGEESALLHGLNLPLRVSNLKKRLALVKTTLHGLGGIPGLTGLSLEDAAP